MTEQPLYCPICKKETHALAPDSIGQVFYRCVNGHNTTKAINEEARKLNLAFEIQAEQNGDKTYIDPLNPMAPFLNEKGRFKPALVAQYFQCRFHFKADRTNELLYYFDCKSWKDNGEVYLQELLARLLGEENRHSIYSDVLHDLKGLVYEDISFSRKIAVENGLLDLEKETVELEPFSPEEMPFHQLPVTYNESATCPGWEEFVKQVVNPDDIATLQEWSGFILLPDYRFHKLLWIFGEGRNGKGVWQRTIEAILGEENFSSVGLEEFDGNHRFALRQLYGSLFNACSEPTTNKILQTPLLKKATGQDTIEAEIKGKQGRLKFRNCAKMTVLANKFPRINDTSVAFKERRLFIKFPNEFTGKNQIQNIEENWTKDPEQKSGILNWMLAGLKRLLEQGYFTESKTQEETEAEFLKASDTISAFLTELAIFDKNRITTRNEAYESYKNYSDVFGLEAENEKKFTERLKNTPKISIGFVHKPKQERAWKGLGLRKLDEEGKILPDATNATLATAFYPQTNKTENKSKDIANKNSPPSVATVANEANAKNPALGESEVGYRGEYVCIFCQKPIDPDSKDWTRDDFTWDKPAHNKCYDDKKSELAAQEGGS
ncbi:MAG: phage/plasmid primase, P4 family [Candidatus Bathyarchaeia archaeon]